MDRMKCPECPEDTILVEDHISGDTICTTCGLVVDSFMVDRGAECRTYEDAPSANRSKRVGEPLPVAASTLLTNGRLSINIAPPKGGGTSGGVESIARRKQAVSDQPAAPKFQSGLAGMFHMADRLDLVKSIKDDATTIFERVKELKIGKGYKDFAVGGACLYLACKQANVPRSFQEISHATGQVNQKVALKKIGHTHCEIEKRLKEHGGPFYPLTDACSTVEAGVFMRRFGSRLKLSNEAIRAAVEAANNVTKHITNVGRAPTSVAAGVAFMIGQLADSLQTSQALDDMALKLLMSDVSKVTSVSKRTVRSTYKVLYEHAHKLVPEWFASNDQLASLLSRP